MKKIALFLIPILFLLSTGCKTSVGPDLFTEKTWVYLQYWDEDGILATDGGCNSWVLCLSDDDKMCEYYHTSPDKDPGNINRSCTTSITWSYDQSAGILTISGKEVNKYVDESISSELQGSFTWRDGEYGERFYSNSNSKVSLYFTGYPKWNTY